MIFSISKVGKNSLEQTNFDQAHHQLSSDENFALNNLDGNSISVPFLGLSANYYVNNFAGGYSKQNKKSSTVVLHANGVTKKSLNLGLFSISPKVEITS